MSKKFKVGDEVLIARKVEPPYAHFRWNPAMDDLVGEVGTVVVDTSEVWNTYGVRVDGHIWFYLRDSLEEVAPPAKVRIVERGKLLDTEFYSPVAAGDWLRDNGVTGEFELVRVESLGKIKASITVEAA